MSKALKHSLAPLLLVAAITWAGHASQTRGAELEITRAEGLPLEVSSELAGELNPRHIKLTMDGQEFCEVWTAKQWQRRSDETAPKAVLYPLEPGILIGVIRLNRPCVDLRDQEIPEGEYTLRYAVQPEIEAHKDTHESRDFLLLVAVGTDQSPTRVEDADQLISMSAESIGGQHPAFFPLVTAKTPGKEPAVRRDERDPDGWLLQIQGTDAAGKSIPLELIMPFADFGN